jgi:hypothetical protein
MSYLTVNGVAISVAAINGPTLSFEEIGVRVGSSDGSHSAAIRGRKRSWTVTTSPLTDAEAASIRTAVAPGPAVTLAGDWADGETISVFPYISKETPLGYVPLVFQLDITMDEA